MTALEHVALSSNPITAKKKKKKKSYPSLLVLIVLEELSLSI
jgi:hypothetical protein